MWTFQYEDTGPLEVTGLCWNAIYSDLFGASYGSYNFYEKAEKGYLCFFSLKNPSYPEFVLESPSGVMCMDIHPTSTHMVVAGLADGNTAVYDLTRRQTGPKLTSQVFLSFYILMSNCILGRTG